MAARERELMKKLATSSELIAWQHKASGRQWMPSATISNSARVEDENSAEEGMAGEV